MWRNGDTDDSTGNLSHIAPIIIVLIVVEIRVCLFVYFIIAFVAIVYFVYFIAFLFYDCQHLLWLPYFILILTFLKIFIIFIEIFFFFFSCIFLFYYDKFNFFLFEVFVLLFAAFKLISFLLNLFCRHQMHDGAWRLSCWQSHCIQCHLACLGLHVGLKPNVLLKIMCTFVPMYSGLFCSAFFERLQKKNAALNF